MSKVFYKMFLTTDHMGLAVNLVEYVSIHETPMMYFCVEKGVDLTAPYLPKRKESETELQYAKRMGMRIRRIHKNGSRIAFDTKEKAFNHLRWMKQRQNGHLKRQISLNDALINNCKTFHDLVAGTGLYQNRYIVPNSHHLFHSHLIF